MNNGRWSYASNHGTVYQLINIVSTHFISGHRDISIKRSNLFSSQSRTEQNCCEYSCTLKDGSILDHMLSIDQDGVSLKISADGIVRILVPVLEFDGTSNVHSEMTQTESKVFYKGWISEAQTNGRFINMGMTFANRNGHYRLIAAESENEVCVHFRISSQ